MANLFKITKQCQTLVVQFGYLPQLEVLWVSLAVSNAVSGWALTGYPGIVTIIKLTNCPGIDWLNPRKKEKSERQHRIHPEKNIILRINDSLYYGTHFA